ncbi:hypothetical protein K1719_003089 [Acacia pycnantha]|nr:hypothetical protein K1719_003089 [Acacia pycnantha]
MSTRNTTNPEDLLSFDPEIERTILTARRIVRLIHKINTELDTQLESDPDHSDCVYSVDLSDCASDSIYDSLVVFTDSSSNFANSDIMAEEQADRHTLKELAAPDVWVLILTIVVVESEFTIREAEDRENLLVNFNSDSLTLINQLIALGKEYEQPAQVRKILNILTKEWEAKVTAIEESRGESMASVAALFGDLYEYEGRSNSKRD